MRKLEELSKISNAVLTPHLNCDMNKFVRSATFSTHSDAGKLSKYDIEFRKR